MKKTKVKLKALYKTIDVFKPCELTKRNNSICFISKPSFFCYRRTVMTVSNKSLKFRFPGA